MSQVSDKKLKQVTLPFYASSPKKRKRENNLSDEEEAKSRRISSPVDTPILTTDALKGSSSNKVSPRETSDEYSAEQSSKTESTDVDMDLDLLIEQIPVSKVPNKLACDRVEQCVSASDTDFNAADTSPLNTSQQSKDSNNETECDLSSEKNPSAGPPKKLTAKQIQKKQEAEAKRLEREKLKQEKEKERLERKEAKEKKRLAEIEAKNEEKRQKEEKRKMKEEELRKQKEAEKKVKEEKQKKLEEIRIKEEQEKKKAEKTVAHFKKYFVTKSKTNVSKAPPENCNNSVNSLFMEFEVKENMKLAPKTRANLSSERRERLETVLRNNKSSERDTYLAQLKSANYEPGRSENTWPLNDDDDLKDDNVQRTQYRCKLLQFSENRRPAYWGTWRKRSKTVSGKTPFKCDSALEYDIDSDEEWVEEPGESLHGSDDEKESDHEYEVDNEVFVPHGYLSDDEANDENPTDKLDLLKTEFEAELKEKTFKLKSRSYGCTWIANSVRKGADDVEELLLFFRGVFNASLTPFCLKPDTEDASTSSTPSQSSKTKTTSFPEEYIPDFIKLAHGSKNSSKNLGVEFGAYILKEASLDLSQVCVKRKLKEIGSWDNSKQLWYIRDEVRQQYGLEELSCNENKSIQCQPKKSIKTANAVEKLPTTAAVSQPPLPTTPKHISITKFVKVLTSEERENQLKMIEVEKRAESPKNVISPKTSLTKFLVRPQEASVVHEVQPIKKRAALFTKDKDGNWIPTRSTTSVTSTAVTPFSGSLKTTPVPPSSENQVTTVNLVIDDVKVNGEVPRCETSEDVKRSAIEPDQGSTATVSDESEERRKKSNVTVKEGRKYATLIPIKKAKGENS